MHDYEENVYELIDKASKVASADEALKFSQAACNAANALRALADNNRADKN